jgi:hypothetical protein
MGTGRCGFSAMISRGARNLKATTTYSEGERYVCPSSTCDQNSEGPIDGEQRREVEQLWGQLEETDFQEMQAFCRGGGYDALGTFSDLTSCLDQEFASLFSDRNNPFDSFNECILDGIKLSEVPGVSENGWATGMPEGINCQLSDGATETSSSTPAAPHEPEAMRVVQPNGQDSYVYISGRGNVYQAWAYHVLETGEVNAEVYVLGFCDDCPDINAHINAAKYLVQEVLRYEGESERKIARSLVGEVAGDVSGESVVADQSGIRPMRESRDCFDATACNNECTAMGRLITAAETCTEDMLDAFATAMGRNRREIKSRRELATYPRPDDFAADGGDNLGTCFSTYAPQSPIACGVMLCPSGGLADVAGDECDCGGDGGGREPARTLCSLIRCTDNTAPDPLSCACHTAEGLTAIVGGGLDPSTTLDWCLLDRDSGSFLYDHGSSPTTLMDVFGRGP